MPEERQIERSRPHTRGQGRLASAEEAALSGFQAGIPQERVNEKSTTMKRMIEGTPNAT